MRKLIMAAMCLSMLACGTSKGGKTTPRTYQEKLASEDIAAEICGAAAGNKARFTVMGYRNYTRDGTARLVCEEREVTCRVGERRSVWEPPDLYYEYQYDCRNTGITWEFDVISVTGSVIIPYQNGMSAMIDLANFNGPISRGISLDTFPAEWNDVPVYLALVHFDAPITSREAIALFPLERWQLAPTAHLLTLATVQPELQKHFDIVALEDASGYVKASILTGQDGRGFSQSDRADEVVWSDDTRFLVFLK